MNSTVTHTLPISNIVVTLRVSNLPACFNFWGSLPDPFCSYMPFTNNLYSLSFISGYTFVADFIGPISMDTICAKNYNKFLGRRLVGSFLIVLLVMYSKRFNLKATKWWILQLHAWNRQKDFSTGFDLRAFVRIVNTKALRLKRREVPCLFKAVVEPIILQIFIDAATLQILGLV